MAEIKDKVVTVESLSALHEYNEDAYMTKVDPNGTGSFSMNRRIGSDIGSKSNTFGALNTASGDFSFAEGYMTTASGERSHAEGNETVASGNYSHAEGASTKASGAWSHAEGASTIASSDKQHVQGMFNIEDAENVYAHIVGNGSNNDMRSNAHTIDWHGNAWFAGDLNADGNIILSSNQYGDKFPTDPVDDGGKGEPHIVGRIFFKRLTDT